MLDRVIDLARVRTYRRPEAEGDGKRISEGHLISFGSIKANLMKIACIGWGSLQRVFLFSANGTMTGPSFLWNLHVSHLANV